MKPYNRTTWKDHVVDPGTGAVIQQGTPQSAANFNNMEEGIFANDAFATVLVQEIMQNKRSIADIEADSAGENLTLTLTNSQSYPFNNSIKTVALSKTRNTLNYRVIAEVQSMIGGFVGDIRISDKALNGFKIAYDGSATSVTLKLYVQGGMYS